MSESGSNYVSCSTYSGLTQNEIQFEYKQPSLNSNDLNIVKNSSSSETSVSSTSTCLEQQTSIIWKSYQTEGRTFDSVPQKVSENGTENQTVLDTLDFSNSYTTHDITSERTLGGKESTLIENKEKQKTPVRAKRKKRSKKNSLKFLDRMIKNKRQNALVEEYKSMSTLLNQLIKQQQNAPKKNRKERIRCKNLIKKIRTLFRILRKKLKKRNRLQRILVRKRLQRDRQRRVHERLKKILRVVYFKRQQRIRNMRDLRIRERKRLADNLMFQAAKLRARANRLTGGREVKYTQRKVKKANAILMPPKEPELNEELAAGDQNNNIKSSQIDVKTSMQQVLEPNVKKHKRRRTKLRKKRPTDKHARKTKALDGKLNNLSERMKSLLVKLSTFSKKQKNSKNVSKFINTLSLSAKAAPEPADALKKKSRKKRKNTRRKPRQAWWRKARLRAAKIRQEKPKLDGFGSDSDVYNIPIRTSSLSSKKQVIARENLKQRF